jgi:glycosyltransferase involved in cell wall biosynthesis
MISIIIPVFNQAGKLKLSLKSLEKQTYQDFEVIVVNDGSDDNVEEIFAQFVKQTKLENSFLFLNQKNLGAPAARNRGFKEAKGNYLLFCDADAILYPEALLKMKQALDYNLDYSYCYSSFYWGRKLFKLETFKAEKLKKEPYIHTISLIRREDFPKTAWDEGIKKFQDWDLWLTMLKNGKKGYFIDQVLFKVIPGGTISSWLPSFCYKLLPFLPLVKKYNQAKKIILKKHDLL